MRVGLIATKLGQSRIYTADSLAVCVTLLKVSDCVVTEVKDSNTESPFMKAQVGAFIDEKKVNKPQAQALRKKNILPRRVLKEFHVARNALPPVGHNLNVDHYIIGQYVDVTGTSIGKGFAGVMKRHNFRGLEASHGVSVSHRSHGSTGQRQDPGKVFKGKKMAGHMGCVKVTTQNLEVMYVNPEQGIIGVCGAVPGAKNSIVTIQDAVKKALPVKAPFPVKKAEESAEAA